MTKDDLVKIIAEDTNISRKQISAIIDNLMKCIKEAISEGDIVILKEFGIFENVLRHKRNFHAAPGKIITIPEHYEVRLRFSKFVKDAIK